MRIATVAAALWSLAATLYNPQDTVTTGRPADAFPVQIHVDCSRRMGTLSPIWRFFGADEPNYATMKDGRRLLGELGKLDPDQVYFRTHNLLTTGDGTPALKWGSTNAYTEDAQGRPVYDWTILDSIFDTYRKRRMRPYVQIGFMPEALSIKPVPYKHHWSPTAKYDEIYTGWSYPPRDYSKWGELAYQWTKHCVERYGRPEVEKWYWEVWNEPNIGYWHGTPEEFQKLHDFAVAGVRRALPTARVGGPDVAGGGGAYLQGFLDHCLRGTNYATGQTGTPIDFISFHAKGSPRFVNGHVEMGIASQLRNIDAAFAQISAIPELRSKPIIIGESDPDGCAACQGPQLDYRNGTLYASYTAAAFARKHDLAAKYGVHLEGALTWAFEFEDQPYFAGFRVLATNGIDLPVLNVFRMFAKMRGDRVAVTSDSETSLVDILKTGVREKPDVSALASCDGHRLSILVWHYHDDDVPGPAADVALNISGLVQRSGEARIDQFRIDDSHSNAFTEWKRMGSPKQPDAAQVKRLVKAGSLTRTEPPTTISIANGTATLNLKLPRQAVAFVTLDWPQAKSGGMPATGSRYSSGRMPPSTTR